MDNEDVGKLLGGLLTGGTAGDVVSAINEGLKLANHLMEPDPAKRAKVRRDYYMNLLKIIKEVQNANPQDVTDLVHLFTTFMDE